MVTLSSHKKCRFTDLFILIFLSALLSCVTAACAGEFGRDKKLNDIPAEASVKSEAAAVRLDAYKRSAEEWFEQGVDKMKPG